MPILVPVSVPILVRMSVRLFFCFSRALTDVLLGQTTNRWQPLCPHTFH